MFRNLLKPKTSRILKIFLLTFILTFLQLYGVFGYVKNVSAAVCTLKITLLEKGSPVSAPNGVSVDKYKDFGLRVAGVGCVANDWYRVRYKIGSGNLQEFSPPKQQALYTEDFSFGKPDVATYTYVAEKSPTGTWLTLDSGYSKAELSVKWVKGATMNPIGNPSGPGASTTSPATSTTTGTKEPAKDINSSVGITTNGSFDDVLGTFFNPLEFETVPELIIRLINIGLLLAAMVAVVVIIAGGFSLVTAAGNESKITQGKNAIIWAIGGLIVCLMSFSIVAIVEKVISK